MTAIAAQIAPAVSEQTPDDPVAENNPAQELSPSVSLIPYFAELICSEGISEKLFALRFDALRDLQVLLSQYDKRRYSAKLLNSIGEKKGAMIMSADSKTEVNKILRPKAPHYDGVRFVSDRYLLPEEELICWSEASLRAPLNEAGYRRYMELFQRAFPEESEALDIA